MRILLLLITFVSLTHLHGQENAIYSFNDCSLSDATGQQADAITTGSPDCECGVIENGLYFDGSNDNLIFPAEIDSLMEEDFTISFYFRLEAATNITDIFSVRATCTSDSLVAFQYLPTENQWQLQIGNTVADILPLSTVANDNLCWHRFVLTKNGLFYSWYMDGELADTYLANASVLFGETARASIANSPCLAFNQDRFQGWIDEFVVYPRALSPIELANNDLQPDRIITENKTILEGTSTDIVAGPTCAGSWTWSPTASIDDPSLLDIEVTPEETTNYVLSLQNSDGCVAIDTVTIFVIDENTFDCEKLLLPNAFTPNGDQLNDLYGISNLFIVDDVDYFQIYNRWGAKIWETSVKEDTWDGSWNGGPVDPATYLYKIKYTCRGEEYVKVDNFSVLR